MELCRKISEINYLYALYRSTVAATVVPTRQVTFTAVLTLLL